MLWLQPAAWLGLVAVAAPLLIHLLAHRRSEPLVFPTLQFLQPTRFASIRRHALDDLGLLLVRAALLAAAVAALAGPVLTSAARRASWDRRLARAIVVDPVEPGREARAELARRESAAAFRSTIVETSDVADGLRRAAAWLDDVPPARREIVCVSSLPIGAVTAADVAAVPREVGLRFVQRGSLPETRTISSAAVLTGAGSSTATADRRAEYPAAIQGRTTTLTGNRTSVADAARGSSITLPLDVVAPVDAQPLVDAAVTAVLQQRTFTPAAGRTATLLIAGAPDEVRVRASAAPIHTPWIGDAVARIATDPDVASAAGEVHARAPEMITPHGAWQTIASGADGAAIASAAQAGNRLLVVSAAPPGDLLTPLLIRSILDALSSPTDLRAAEIVPIPDSQLRAWERLPGPAQMPTAHGSTDDVSDDRRWMWAAALCLLGLEGWVRGRSDDAAADRAAAEADRVA
jgi:hypothetical protein